ncbi:MAG: FAD binding domain-containing protein [Methyloligellaceae bacterium]
MKPAPFKYVAATSIEEALSYKAQFGDEARFLAGGQSLIPIMNFRLARPGFLIDINRLNELSSISQNEDGVSIGALTRHGELERSAIVSSTHAIACEAIKEVAHPQIRNRGTLCGNIAHADPASEMPAVMLALQARFKAKSATGERWIEARDFFQGVFETTLADNEMLKEIELPKLETDAGSCFIELARRQGDYAIAGVAAIVTLDEKDHCRSVRLAYCGCGETPLVAELTQQNLIGEPIDEKTARAAGESAAKELDPTNDVHADADYKRHIAAVLTKRALLKAREQAQIIRLKSK